MKVPNISVFSAAMQGGFGLSSVLNVDMISLQPTFMMITSQVHLYANDIHKLAFISPLLSVSNLAKSFNLLS